MTLVRKVSDDWKPMEYPGLKVGDIVDVTNPDTLLAEGKVELAKETPKAPVVKGTK